MKLAIMQPYLFPYIGYFQLINVADKFVVYDDITFIKQGWINRNCILLNGVKHLVTIPVKSISSHTLISDTIVSNKPDNWEHKLSNTIRQAYNKAPFFSEVFPLIESVLLPAKGKVISDVIRMSIHFIMGYVGINTIIVESSSIYQNHALKNQERVIDICKKEKANTYINAIGGSDLYSAEQFMKKNITLQFLKSNSTPYQQFTEPFVPSLSIIEAKGSF